MNNKFLIAFSLCLISFTSISQQLEKLILENWKDGAWENRMQELPFYNEEGRIIRKEIAHWDVSSSEWIDQTKTEFKRDENGILLSREQFKWNSELSAWQASLRTSYSVNDQNKPSSILTEAQNASGWYNQSIDEYEYDASGNAVKKQLSRWDRVALSWVPYRKMEYTIEADRTAEYTIYFWDKKLEEWSTYRKASYHYTEADKLDHIVFETWAGGEWKNHSVRRNIRDEEGALNMMEVHLFENELEIWSKSSHVDYELTDFGKFSSSTNKKWNPKNSSWENLQRSTYYYSKDGEMISEWSDNVKDVELFPNPATENLTIRSATVGTITILDALGKIVLQIENNDSEMHIDVSKWEMGVYSVQIDGNEIQQFIKQ